MKWVRFRVRTVPEAEDIIVSEMSEIGMCGAQIEDNVPLTASEKERIYTFDADDPNNAEIAEGEAYVSFYAELNEEGKLCVTESDQIVQQGGPPADGIFVTPDEQLARMNDCLTAIRQYTEIGAGTVTVSQMDDIAWKDKWKEYFHSFWIDDILVTPSWEEEPQDLQQANYVLHIDPGTAFGTGAHETTQLAIRAIRKLIRTYKSSTESHAKNSTKQEACDNDRGEAPVKIQDRIRMLDIGTGSGILSIMALMFGADACVGTDLDPFTEEAVRENLEANQIDIERFKLILGNIIDDVAVRKQVLEESFSDRGEAGYDIVAANILPVVLVPLTPVVPQFIKPGGYYVTSGILTEKKDMMKKVIADAGLEIVETSVQGEWCSIIAKKP